MCQYYNTSQLPIKNVRVGSGWGWSPVPHPQSGPTAPFAPAAWGPSPF